MEHAFHRPVNLYFHMNTTNKTIAFDRCNLKTLWSINQFYASNFCAISKYLVEMSHLTESIGRDNKQSSKQLRNTKLAMGLIAKKFKEIGLLVSSKWAEEAQKNLSPENPCVAKNDLDALIRIFELEMESEIFLHLEKGRIRFYDDSKKPLFGEKVFRAFPSAADDISEAGKCLATGRNTACVFHLMRVMEAGLIAIAKKLGVLYQNDWGHYLREIKNCLDDLRKNKPRGWNRKWAFFTDTAAHISTVKNAWRNPTMHIVKQYSNESAEDIFNSVKSFMRHLASNMVSETK